MIPLLALAQLACIPRIEEIPGVQWLARRLTQYNQNYGHENDQMNEQMSSRYYKRLAKDIQKK